MKIGACSWMWHDKNTDQNWCRGGKGLPGSQVTGKSRQEHTAETRRQELTQRLWRDASGWVASDFLRYLSCCNKVHLPKSGTTRSGLGLSTSITKKENHKPAQGWSNRGNYSTKVPFVQVMSLCQAGERGWKLTRRGLHRRKHSLNLPKWKSQRKM